MLPVRIRGQEPDLRPGTVLGGDQLRHAHGHRCILHGHQGLRNRRRVRGEGPCRQEGRCEDRPREEAGRHRTGVQRCGQALGGQTRTGAFGGGSRTPGQEVHLTHRHRCRRGRTDHQRQPQDRRCGHRHRGQEDARIRGHPRKGHLLWIHARRRPRIPREEPPLQEGRHPHVRGCGILQRGEEAPRSHRQGRLRRGRGERDLIPRLPLLQGGDLVG